MTGIPGDLIETGVWRGGVCVLMRAVLEAYGVRDRRVWVADSFEGVPVTDGESHPLDRQMALHRINQVLSVAREEVADILRPLRTARATRSASWRAGSRRPCLARLRVRWR